MTQAPIPGPGKAIVAELVLSTNRRTQLLEVTAGVAKLVVEARVASGVCHLYVPHTTAGITINENADPDVVLDMVATLDRLVPQRPDYRHAEGNSDSHVKAALIGNSASVFIASGKLDLGRWQGIFFCEFDGPRQRRLRVKIVAD